jgi:hypothetical protein
VTQISHKNQGEPENEIDDPDAMAELIQTPIAAQLAFSTM